jgi:hypothetical protein
MLALALCVLICGSLFALFSGGDWQAALGGLFGVLLAAMNSHMPLKDWIYPKDDEKQQDEGEE